MVISAVWKLVQLIIHDGAYLQADVQTSSGEDYEDAHIKDQLSPLDLRPSSL